MTTFRSKKGVVSVHLSNGWYTITTSGSDKISISTRNISYFAPLKKLIIANITNSTKTEVNLLKAKDIVCEKEVYIEDEVVVEQTRNSAVNTTSESSTSETTTTESESEQTEEVIMDNNDYEDIGEDD